MNVEAYVPDLPERDWARVRDFVLQVVDAVRAALPYPLASLVNAVAHHVDWCVSVARLPLTADALFRRDVIGAAVGVMPTRSPSTKGRRRSLLLRVGEHLGIIDVPVLLTPLSAATPTTPYTPTEVSELVTWAHHQRRTDIAVSARVLLALGLGAGLPTRDLGAVTAADVHDAGGLITVAGRAVPVREEWADELDELRELSDCSAPLFHPRVPRSKNFVTLFVNRSIGLGLRPTTQRMRSTWLTTHLAEGMPMQDLLYAAGLKSMDALVRYERFLPAPTTSAPGDSRG